jgi:hypothetical protein
VVAWGTKGTRGASHDVDLTDLSLIEKGREKSLSSVSLSLRRALGGGGGNISSKILSVRVSHTGGGGRGLADLQVAGGDEALYGPLPTPCELAFNFHTDALELDA